MTNLERWAAAVGLAVVLSGCANGEGDAGPVTPAAVGPEAGMGDERTQLLRAAPQRSDGRSVLVERVVFGAGRGYLAIHEDGNGAPGKVIGVSKLLAAGDHTRIVVPVEPALPKGVVRVWPVVHVEDNGNESFDYPTADQPAALDGGSVVVVPVEVTVT